MLVDKFYSEKNRPSDEGKQPQPVWIQAQKMYCFCTAGMPIRAILAISEDVVSGRGEVTQPLLFQYL